MYLILLLLLLLLQVKLLEPETKPNHNPTMWCYYPKLKILLRVVVSVVLVVVIVVDYRADPKLAKMGIHASTLLQ